jgi:hypothetical protein
MRDPLERLEIAQRHLREAEQRAFKLVEELQKARDKKLDTEYLERAVTLQIQIAHDIVALQTRIARAECQQDK